MILTAYFGFLILCLILIFAGKYTNSPVLQIGAFSFLFILGIILMLGAVEYKTGEIESYSYICTACNTSNTTTYSCFGDPDPCDTFDRNETECLLFGCYWNDTICNGNPNECETYTDMDLCTLAGCNISSTTINGSEGVNVTEVGSIIRTDTYSNYDSEIVQGLMIHHILGFIISILSALGFISALFNLKEDAIN